MSVSRLSLALLAVAAVTLPTAAMAQKATDEFIYIVGAVNDPANTDTTQDASDSAAPALPVVYENEKGE
jgi:hypothetical protein